MFIILENPTAINISISPWGKSIALISRVESVDILTIFYWLLLIFRGIAALSLMKLLHFGKK